VAAKISARTGSAPGRWYDFDIDPNLGVVRSGQPYSLLWETYGLTPRDGNDEYDVNIKVARVRSGGIGALAAKIEGGVAGLVGISHGGNDEVTLSFPRRIPAKNVALDHVTLDLGDASPGRYDLEVIITDRATGQRVVEKSSITVVE
jgi:hypothetical protein